MSKNRLGSVDGAFGFSEYMFAFCNLAGDDVEPNTKLLRGLNAENVSKNCKEVQINCFNGVLGILKLAAS